MRPGDWKPADSPRPWPAAHPALGTASEYRAIVLAAGRGRRLLPHTQATPKCLLDIGGTTILEQQLTVLKDVGVRDIVLVTGFASDQVERTVGDGARYVHNPDYASTNSAHSLWVAKRYLDRPCIVLNADVLFGHDVAYSLLTHPFPDAIAYDASSAMSDEETKVRLGHHGRIEDIGKDLLPRCSQGEHLGLIRLSRIGAGILAGRLRKSVAEEGPSTKWVPQILRAQLGIRPVFGVDVSGSPWVEVDFEGDLFRARDEVYPRLLRRERTWQSSRVGSDVPYAAENGSARSVPSNGSG